MIRVRELRVDYGDFCAVRDISFDVGEGDVFGLIGPNGSGKTSTFRALLGLLEPTYGSIEIAGLDVVEHPDKVHLVLGYMPDYVPMYEDLMVWEFLDLFAASYFVPIDQRPTLIDAHLRLVGLLEKKEAFVGGLSRGMRQRLLLAKTLIPNPQVLLLDEPASGMDPHGRALLKSILRTLRDQGKTVLISSHILSEMSEFCTSVGILERGRMVISGRVESVAAQVMGGALVTVELLGGRDVFEAVVREDPAAGAISARDGVVEFPYSGDPRAASELLARLVRAGVPVAGFQRRTSNLEEIFLKVGAKELS